MSFKDFTTLNEAAARCNVVVHRREFIDYSQVKPVLFEKMLSDRLRFDLTHTPTAPEVSLCETMIYPLLREAWLRHQTLQVWREMLLRVDDVLTGMPDYLICKPSPLGIRELVAPIMAVVETKRDDFEMGWGQCLAEMVAAQRFNADKNPNLTVYGIVTTGKVWEFGKLEGRNLTIDLTGVSLLPNVDVLLGVLDHFFALCEEELKKLDAE